MKKMNVFLAAMILTSTTLFCVPSLVKDIGVGVAVGAMTRGTSYTLKQKAGATNGQAMLGGAMGMTLAIMAAGYNVRYQNANWVNQMATAFAVCLASMYIWSPLGDEQDTIAQAQAQPVIQPVVQSVMQSTQNVQPIKTH